MSQERRIDVNWVQALGGALAAMSSAVLLSTVGVTGTIIGAAVGSVVASVGSAVYSHYLALSQARVAAASAAALERAARVKGRRSPYPRTQTTASAADPRQDELGDPATGADEADETGAAHAAGVGSSSTTGAEDPVTTEDDRTGRWIEALHGLAWRRIAAVSLGVFILAMGAILTLELVTGRALSAWTGGSDADGPRTSLNFGGGSGSDRQQPDQEPARTPGDEPTTSTTTSTPSDDTTVEETTEPPTTEPSTTVPTTTPATSAPSSPPPE